MGRITVHDFESMLGLYRKQNRGSGHNAQQATVNLLGNTQKRKHGEVCMALLSERSAFNALFRTRMVFRNKDQQRIGLPSTENQPTQHTAVLHNIIDGNDLFAL